MYRYISVAILMYIVYMPKWSTNCSNLIYKTNNKVTPRLQFLLKILTSINITQKSVCCLSFSFLLGHICSLYPLFKWAIACSRYTKFMLDICTKECMLRSACLNKYLEKFLKFCDLGLCTMYSSPWLYVPFPFLVGHPLILPNCNCYPGAHRKPTWGRS